MLPVLPVLHAPVPVLHLRCTNAGSNWAQWMARLGVNSARVFLTATWGLSLESWVGSSRWGQSLSGSPVTDEASFQAAVAELRTPAGHDPALVSRFANPVK